MQRAVFFKIALYSIKKDIEYTSKYWLPSRITLQKRLLYSIILFLGEFEIFEDQNFLVHNRGKIKSLYINYSEKAFHLVLDYGALNALNNRRSDEKLSQDNWYIGFQNE